MQDLRKAGGHENRTRVSHRYEHILPVLFFCLSCFCDNRSCYSTSESLLREYMPSMPVTGFGFLSAFQAKDTLNTLQKRCTKALVPIIPLSVKYLVL